MCDLVEKYARDHAEEYAEEYTERRSVCSVIEALSKINFSKNEIIDSVIDQFNITKEDAESYYNDFVK